VAVPGQPEPEEIVGLIDFRYLSDALTPDEALGILRKAEPTRAGRVAQLTEQAIRPYTTSPGWLGYSDEKLARLAKQAIAEGFDMIKLKVGGDLHDDVRRMKLAREVVGGGVRIAVDANPALGHRPGDPLDARAGAYSPYWIEEPTSPDDVLATGRSPTRWPRSRSPPASTCRTGWCSSSCYRPARRRGADRRLPGRRRQRDIAILLLAAKFGVPVCPHAGGVGLCELVRHLSFFDYAAVSASMGRPGHRVGRPPARALHDPAAVVGGRTSRRPSPGSPPSCGRKR